MNGSLILGRIVIGQTFGWNSLQGETFSMACLQAKAMVKLHPIAMVAPKPIMAWVTASTERDCQKKGFILKDASPRLAKSPASPLLAKCDASPLLAKFHH